MISRNNRITALVIIGMLSLVSTLAQNVTSLTLINANTDADIRVLQAEDTIDLALVGSALNIRANVSGTVGSVKFGLNDEPAFRTESTAPYAMAGDVAPDYWVWTPDLGMNTITATSYSEGSASGTPGTPFVIHLFVENSDDVGNEGTVYPLPEDQGTGAVSISGQLKKWHKITLDFDGPAYNETDIQPNPFLDYKLSVSFTNGTKTYNVPGYFAVDGSAAETSAESGNVWRVHFSPDAEGDWDYTVSMRLGGYAAVSDSAEPGIAVPSIDGATGMISIGPSDKTGIDNRAKGRLQYIGSHYLKYAETGNLFVKGGPDAPENFLAYDDFDNTPNNGGYRKSWSGHAADYNAGNPSWQGGKGTEIIGALNYLASEGLNAFSFLTMNINGDDKNVYPYITNSNYFQFDCSKLDQWEIVFTHADSLGMFLHFKTQETENEMLLDNGDTDAERKLYYRELIARFGHHLALNWNLGEENGNYGATNQSTSQRKAMAAYFAENDPYKHSIVVHTAPNYQDEIYTPLLGLSSELTGASIQTNWSNVHSETSTWVTASADAGKRWVVANDEQGGANIGVPDDTYTGSPSLDDIRQQTLWGNLMAGGGGVEYYFGYDLPQSDLYCQDYRSRDTSWDYVRYAIEFFSDKPLDLMTPNDGLVSQGWCLAQPGSIYIIYLPNGGSSNLTLSDAGTYTIQWYNPRTGGALQVGDVTSITGSGAVSIGNPPANATEDWAVLVTKDLGGNEAPVAQFTVDSLEGTAPLVVTFNARSSYDNDGLIAAYSWDFGDQFVGSDDSLTHTFNEGGFYQVVLTVEDNEGAQSSSIKYIQVDNAPAGSACGTEFEIMSIDFPYSETDFYLDTYTGMELLAINPTPPNPASATVSTTFSGESCHYNVILHTIGENDGQSEFVVSIGGESLGTFVVPLSTETWEMGDTYNYTWEGVEITNGDAITVQGTTASNDTEWSRARWLKIEFVPAECLGEGFVEREGLLVIEAESLAEYASGWEIKSSISEATGGSYIEYTGADNMGSANMSSNLEFPIIITTPGTYRFQWRSRNGEGAAAYDQENDSWLMIECDDFYGLKDGTRTDIGTDYAKVWIQSLTSWSWDCFGEHGTNGLSVYATFDEAGEYMINVAGRSRGHVIDRIIMYLPDQTSAAQNIATPVSDQGCGSSGVNAGFATPKTYRAEYLIDAITIDGSEENAWSIAESAEGAFEADDGALPESSDLDYTFKAVYDNDYFYIIAHITDEDLNAYSGTGSTEDYDNIEIFFNPDNQHQEGGSYGADAIQLRLNYGISDNSITVNGTWQAPDFSEVEYSTVNTDDGYILEARLPWDGIIPAGVSFEEGMTIGYEVSVNDNDGGSSIQHTLAWANNTGSNRASIDTRCFGSMILMDGPIICPGDPGCSGGKSLTVYRFDTPPTIDADKSEWSGFEAHAGEYEILGKAMPTASDLSYEFYVGWTDDYFYILLDAIDNSLNALVGANVSGWEWDNLEVFFNPDNRHEANGALGDDGIQMRMNYGRTDNLYSGNGTWKGGPNYEGFMFSTAATLNGYIIEGQIPWNGAFPASVDAVAGHIFGFDVAVGDNDNGSSRENMVAWANDTGADLNSRDTRVYGFAQLSDEVAGVTAIQANEEYAESVKIYLLNSDILRVENVRLNSSLKIINISGQLLMQRKMLNNHEDINISQLSKGVYVVCNLGESVVIVK